MPGCTALLLSLMSTGRNLKAKKHLKEFSPREFIFNINFLTTVLQLQYFDYCSSEFHSFSSSSFQIIFTWKINPFKLFWKTKQHTPSVAQELLSVLFIRRKAEPKLGHIAMPYKSPSIRIRQKYHLGFCNPASVLFSICVWDEFNWRFVTCLYLKNPQKSQTPTSNSQDLWKRHKGTPQTSGRFFRTSILHLHQRNCRKLTDFYRNSLFWEVHGECYQARWAPAFCILPKPRVQLRAAKSDRMARGAQVPCFPPSCQHPLPLRSTGHLLHAHAPLPERAQERPRVSQQQQSKTRASTLKQKHETKEEKGGGGGKNLQWNKTNRSFSAAQQAPSKCQQFQKSCNL